MHEKITSDFDLDFIRKYMSSFTLLDERKDVKRLTKYFLIAFIIVLEKYLIKCENGYFLLQRLKQIYGLII